MQAVLKFPSKCLFPPPLTRVSAVLSPSGHPPPPYSKEYSDFWGQSQKYVAIGSAQCRHRPAGGQPGRDVAARTAGAEHPTTVFVGCGACKMYIHSDRLTSLSQSTALGIYAGRVLKARCASYAQGLALHALCLVTKLSHHWAMYH